MKKIILLVLALALVLSFAACSKVENPDKDKTPATENDGENKPTEDNKPEEKTWGDASCEDIVNTIISQLDIQLMMPALMPITPESNMIQGLAPDGETGEGGIDFADGAVYIPMISSQRFDMAVFRVKEGADVNAFVEDLKTRNASQQWICATPPDFVKVIALDDVVLYLSINKMLTDGDAIVEKFQNPIPVVKVEDETTDGETTDGETTDGETGEELA